MACKQSNPYRKLRLVFTSDGVIVGVVNRSVECSVIVKIKLTESEAVHRITSAYDSVDYDLVKTKLLESEAERKAKPITTFVSGPWDWLVLPLLLPTPNM